MTQSLLKGTSVHIYDLDHKMGLILRKLISVIRMPGYEERALDDWYDGWELHGGAPGLTPGYPARRSATRRDFIRRSQLSSALNEWGQRWRRDTQIRGGWRESNIGRRFDTDLGGGRGGGRFLPGHRRAAKIGRTGPPMRRGFRGDASPVQRSQPLRYADRGDHEIVRRPTGGSCRDPRILWAIPVRRNVDVRGATHNQIRVGADRRFSARRGKTRRSPAAWRGECPHCVTPVRCPPAHGIIAPRPLMYNA